jgi:hypothetical protein
MDTLYQRITSQQISSNKEKYIKAIKKYILTQKYILTPKLIEKIYTSPEISDKINDFFPNSQCLYQNLIQNQNYCWFTPEEKSNGFECAICFEHLIPKPNEIIELALCGHQMCIRCFIKVKKHDNIICPMCRKNQKSKYLLNHTKELEQKFNSQIEIFQEKLNQVNKELWSVESDVNFNSDSIYKLLLETNLLFDEFAKTPVKINQQILTNIKNFIDLKIPNKHGTELVMTKLMRLRLSREDFIDIEFYKTCLELEWIA